MNNSNFNHHTVPTQYIDIEGISFAYRTFGVPSEVPIVCLQHFTGTLDNWDPIITNGLASQRQVILIDNRGVGNSGGETPDNVEAMAEDTLKIIDALGIHRCDLLGFSLGGFIAQLIAVRKPELLRKVIIVGSAPQGVEVLHTFPQLIEKAMKLEPMERFLFIFFTSSEKSRAKGLAALGRLIERTQDRDADAKMQAISAQITALTRWGTDAPTIELNKIQLPVLIVSGSNDEMMESMNSVELFKSIPNSIVTLYPDSAHGSFFQYPEIFVDQANSFLNKFD